MTEERKRLRDTGQSNREVWYKNSIEFSRRIKCSGIIKIKVFTGIKNQKERSRVLTLRPSTVIMSIVDLVVMSEGSREGRVLKRVKSGG